MGAARFESESFTIKHAGRSVVVGGLSGWRFPDGEVVFDNVSARRYAEAGDELVLADRRSKCNRKLSKGNSSIRLRTLPLQGGESGSNPEWPTKTRR